MLQLGKIMKSKDYILMIVLLILIVFSFFYINLYSKYDLKFYQDNYYEMMSVNIVIEVLLFIIIGYFVIKIFKNRSNNIFSTRINKVLFIILSLIVILPTFVTIMVTNYFTTNSIAIIINNSVQNKNNILNELDNYNKIVYMNTLFLILLLSFAISTLISIFLSEFINKRINKLIENINLVNQGEYGKIEIVSGDDELSNVIKLFNSMSKNLKKIKKLEELKNTELNDYKNYLENVLDNTNAGIIVYDNDFKVLNINKLIYKMFSIKNFDLKDISLLELGNKFSIFNSLIKTINEKLMFNNQGWESDILVKNADEVQNKLHIKNIKFKFNNIEYCVMLISDVTNLIQIRENQMWSDIAKRLAHEIKNPLTPIVISAERIEMKLLHKLDITDQAFLKRLTNQIILQVDELGVLINKFRDFADINKPNLFKTDIIVVVSEVLTLYENYKFIKLNPIVDTNLYAYVDASLFRQVIHNLIKNSLESLIKDDKKIEISIYRDGRFVSIKVWDNGDGFKDHILNNAFQPYQTTKGAKGSGLGLAIVKKIIDEHNGIIKIYNNNGACVIISIPIIE